jgi:hypothetical protein
VPLLNNVERGLIERIKTVIREGAGNCYSPSNAEIVSVNGCSAHLSDYPSGFILKVINIDQSDRGF